MSISQFSSPIIVNSNNEVRLLERISFGSKHDSFTYNEEWLQNLLFKNPESLPVNEVDTSYKGLVPVCTELNTPAGPIDALFATPEGKLVLLEVKLWRNPEARRKVIGQILDYAKELNKWDYEELQKQVSKRTSIKGNSLFKIISDCHPDIDESEFVDEISRSLETGRFLLIIIGDGIREGIGAIAKFLEDVGQLSFTLGLVEVGIYKKDENELFIQPRVLAKTAIINRTVLELASSEIVVRSKEIEETEDNFYSIFWNELLSELQLDDAAQKPANITKSENIYFSMPPSGSQAWVSAYFASSKSQVGVYLRFTRGVLGDLLYDKLEEEKDEINRELGKDIEWYTRDGAHSIAIRKNYDDVFSNKNRNDIKKFFSANINSFVNTFRERLERISEQIEK